ncbi:SARP family transcriptional regulator [Micromonospora qiuiae]|uniref:SARP family transcriptional regulator n=1 Tax=Micromonospora qiuiae TaxID=502268 RepID=A0ABQ4JGC9_9ACTN|nr:BTAD domain-containing putative transcriptional regulator [Micromonospora qiuiae]GIJ29573.1 SARP family transcriptional regulator [Micromonospora qiuiae]
MHFRLLGPLRVSTAADDEVWIGRPKLRLLLVLLLTRANTSVPMDTLVDDLWGANPPESALSNLRTYVWSLRRLLAPADPATAPISTDSSGYMIGVSPERLDMLTFERLIADGADARRLGDLELVARRLEQALKLWRGAAFEGIQHTSDMLAATAQRLEEQRLAAVEELFDARLGLGRHAEAIAELQGWIVQYPLRERLWEQLMLALYRHGRQADALAAYQQLRTRLVEEIGVEPSQPLRMLQARILRSDPALAPPAGVATVVSPVNGGLIPRQLPLDVPTFVGRKGELATLGELLDPDNGSGHGSVVIIHGPPGVGKSALAVHAVEPWASRFPDGQLYVNLRGATPGVEPLSPGEGLGRFLRALGVPAAEVPHDIEEAAGLYRTLVAARRMVILLDNAATADQVRPLLPGTSRTAVLVTSRAGLTALEGATHVGLGPLDPDASRAMLERLIGDARAADDPPATARLVELCDRMPLGLHVAAARLKTRPTWAVRDLVERLTDEQHRLSELASGVLAVRSSLGVSYAALARSDDPGDRAAARALCLIGLMPVTDIDSHTAAALLDTSPAEADRVIERLLDAHLVEAVEPDRYRIHDLVRLFAREVAASTVAGGDATAVISRLLSYYLVTARDATRLLYPYRTHYPVPDVPMTPKPFTGADEARRWLEAERVNLLAAARQSWRGPDEHARLGIGLALTLHWFLLLKGYSCDMFELNEQAISLARQVGDRRSEAYANGSISGAYVAVGRPEKAEAHIATELSICRDIGDRFGEQRALGNLGLSYLMRDRPEEAIAYLEQQLTVAQQIGATVGEVYALKSLGRAYHQLGRHEEAIRFVEKALAWYDETGDDYPGSGALTRLGLIYIDLGCLDRAAELLARAVERARRIRYRQGEALALVALARASRLLGAIDKAASYVEEAAAITEALGMTRVRALADIEHAAVLDAVDGQRG